jgi:hypothetical protein
MLAPYPATSSRASRSGSSEPTSLEPTVGPSPSRAVDWGARLVQFGLAVYLIPVLVLIFMIGGVGVAVIGLVALTARVVRWGGRSPDADEAEDAVES